ncbi:unnamed protein product [Acanthoscelides obtectus]|uniref:Uncharacterized protein n=1 Tax=Acanthoscelides obtectus TaxID=200917 RepID=A0A9P0QH56_ACAOB|nr:unnamed protein product [Acanthoscelides obtectus]CAH2019753.1 unnamed protein product [Acanthoscelides obtectus]CAH2020113.1 unnamed protein product [Acanthoscelides obtectus]CAH2020118.1 unnamed protein product [Acanthoscelides obtectus]CAK1652212.1 hypothetical protein AOBTE_LOCUS17735 [Acanthoscelides obtectus]
MVIIDAILRIQLKWKKPSYYKIRGNDAYRMISIVNTS